MDLDLSQNLDGPVALLYVRGNEWSEVVKNAVLSLQHIWISGELQTNERFLFELLSHPWFKEGVFHRVCSKEVINGNLQRTVLIKGL